VKLSEYKKLQKQTSEDEDEIIDDDEPYNVKNPKIYVRFDPLHQSHTGPLYGPFDGVEVKKDILYCWRKIGPVATMAVRNPDSLWYLKEYPKEPGYLGFTIVFS